VSEPIALPAGWAPDVESLGPSWEALPPDVQQRALQIAVHTLWALSGRRFGTRTVTLAPYLRPARRSWVDSGRPAGIAVNAAAGYAVGGACGGSVARILQLPGPVVSVEQVLLDGEPFTDWVLDPDGTLVRTDGSAWPVGQDVYAPRWIVRYVKGEAVPYAGNVAVARYALELAKAMTTPATCKLPTKTRDIVRQGVAVTLSDPKELAENGWTGMPSVDAWLRTVNPSGQAENASLVAPAPARFRHRVLA
jgi:hypothetical protein